MSEEIEELVVAARPEGVSDVENELNGMQESLDESAESMGETADNMDSLSQKWKGAMGSIIAGLAAATGFLLSTVPVLGESMSGLSSIISAIGFRLDGILRPAIQPINDLLFKFSQWMYEADGATGALASAIAVLTPIVLGIGTALASWAVYTFGVVGALGKLGAAIKIAGTVIGGWIATIGAIPIAIGLAVAALGLLIWYFREDIVDAIKTAISAITGFASDAKQWGKDLMTNFASSITDKLSDIKTAASDIVSEISDEIGDMIDDAFDWGKDLVKGIIEGLESMLSKVGDAAGEVASTIGEYMPSSPADKGELSNLGDYGPGLIEGFAGGITANTGRIENAASQAAEAASPSDPTGFMASRGGSSDIILNGRRMNKENSKELFSQTASRNRTG